MSNVKTRPQCDVCHKNPATIHITEIVNGKVVEIHMCRECARMKAEQMGKYQNIAELSKSVSKQKRQRKRLGSVRCPSCGISFSDFKKKGLLGCPYCYTAFKYEMSSVIKEVQGTVEHRGKIPLPVYNGSSLERELMRLKENLKRAIKEEAYERAVEIRDKIRKLGREKDCK